jgi:hypothetical protein
MPPDASPAAAQEPTLDDPWGLENSPDAVKTILDADRDD